MAKISLSAAPGLTTVTYSVEWPAGTFGAPQTDAAEVVLGGAATGIYQANEPANWISVIWLDGLGGAAESTNDASPSSATAGGGAASSYYAKQEPDGDVAMKVGEKRRLFASASTTNGTLTIASATARVYKPDGSVLTGYDGIPATGFDSDADSYIRAWLDFDAAALAAGQYAVVFTLSLAGSDGADLRPEVEIALTVSAVP